MRDAPHAQIGMVFDFGEDEVSVLRRRVDDLERRIEQLTTPPWNRQQPQYPAHNGIHPGCVPCIGHVCGNAACPSRQVVC